MRSLHRSPCSAPGGGARMCQSGAFSLIAWLALGSLIVTLFGSMPAWAGDEIRHSGNVHSFTPSEGVLVINAMGLNGEEETVWVDVRGAEVVRLSRHPRRPWQWRERRTSVYRLPAGTYITVIGLEDRAGTLRASRVEVPDLDATQ